MRGKRITKHIKRNSINLNSLAELAKVNPKYTQLYQGLINVDAQIKNWVNAEISNITDPDIYYIKTELMSQCYNILLFNVECQATIGVSWPLADFLVKCQNKSIEGEVIKYTLKIVKRFSDNKFKKNDITWVN